MTLMIGVSGVRGIVGESMTPALAGQVGAAFGAALGGGEVVLGRDSRPSGPELGDAIVGGLRSSGCAVIDLGVCATPGAGIMVLERGAAGGVMITASHNPGEWNGIKFITAAGHAPSAEQVAPILDRIRRKDVPATGPPRGPAAPRDETVHERHVRRVLAIVDADAIRARKFQVVLDSVNGAGGLAGRLLLERLGCRVIHLNGEPTGRFAHSPEPLAENLADLCRVTRDERGAVGFAQDPDADRLAIVDNRGQYIGEECTLALAAKFVFARLDGPAAANLSTSRMIDDLGAAAGGRTVYRTPVGEANVVQALLRHRCVIGGEGNGGVIDPRVVPIRDSLTAMALVLNLLATEGHPLDRVVADLPRYVMVKSKFELDRGRIDAWLTRVRAGVSDARLDASDGLRMDWPQGWVHVRPSNTEPIARVIAEAADRATAEALVAKVTALL